MTPPSDKDLFEAIERIPFPTVERVEAIADLKRVERKMKFDLDHQKGRDLRSGRKLRKEYSSRLFWFLCVWSGFVGLIIFLQGFQLWHFNIANSVMSVFLGTTTVSIVGLMLAIIKGLFPSPKE